MSAEPAGYDPDFLEVPLAVPTPAEGRELVILPSTHFSVGMDPHRRLAAYTAVNIDGGSLVDVPRGDDWHLDERLPAEQQTGPEVYARNDLDRGHLVRRRDPVWGPRADAERANRETFAYTNAAPQAAAFNQGEELWVGLEDYVIGAAEAAGARLSVFTGPVFAGGDASYRGTLIPKRFWKVASWVRAGELCATGYVLDQSELVEGFDDRRTAAGVPQLGAFRTFQVPIADIAALTALHLDAAAAADQYRAQGVQPAGAWRELRAPADIELG